MEVWAGTGPRLPKVSVESGRAECDTDPWLCTLGRSPPMLGYTIMPGEEN